VCARKPIVAIDGPAGAGKSTVARLLAERLGLVYIDTGAMYRAVALAAAQSGVDPADQAAVARLAERARFEFLPQAGAARLLFNGADVTTAIRGPEISALASVVAAIPGVRSALVREQRRLGAGGGVVMEGRDIGSVVFPDADLKLYLDASPGELARRRRSDLEQQGRPVDLEQVSREIAERDRRDSTRSDSPLCHAPGAIYFSTDGLTISEVVDRLAALAREQTTP
jgi:cytidylate kinase